MEAFVRQRVQINIPAWVERYASGGQRLRDVKQGRPTDSTSLEIKTQKMGKFRWDAFLFDAYIYIHIIKDIITASE